MSQYCLEGNYLESDEAIFAKAISILQMFTLSRRRLRTSSVAVVVVFVVVVALDADVHISKPS